MTKISRPFDFENGEILLIDKPKGWTSFDVVKKVRNLIKAKVGHAGTLDPLATGLLILATGRCTKQIEEIQAQTKEYTGSFFLGATTPSYDLETVPENFKDISHLSAIEVVEAANRFTGSIQQAPPVFSAIKVEGKRSYDLARAGKAKTLEARTVEIYDFSIEQVQLPMAYFKVSCSKGTYIRSLAHDFGEALGVGAYLASLCRTKIGDYSLDNAWKVDELAEAIREQRKKPSAE